MNKILKQKIKKIPKKSGAYIFFAKGESASGGKDTSGQIIYVGKARNLRKRIQQHFMTLRLGLRPRSGNNIASQFIYKVTDIDWIKTDNEKQALLLENELIKKYKPRYNIQWKDDKSYFWVKFTQEEWPRVEIAHKPGVVTRYAVSPPVSSKGVVIRDEKRQTINETGRDTLKRKTNYELIGPFVSGRQLRQTLRVLRKIFPFRTCKNPYNKPCLQWHLGLCPAHSTDLRIKNYDLRIKKYTKSLSVLSQFLRLYASESIRIEAYDISNIQGQYATGSMIVFYGDKPSKRDYRKFRIKTVHGANDVAMLKEVLKRRLKHPEWPYADLILIDGGRAQLKAALLTTVHRLPSTAVISLAKREEEIYTEYSDKPLKINKLSSSLRLIFEHIRDEAHRFAIFYYRYLHETRDFRRTPKTIRKTR